MDLLKTVAHLRTAERAAAAVATAAASADGADADLLATVAEVLDHLPPLQRATLFSHPLACLDAPGSGDEDTKDGRTLLDRTRTMARHLIGHPDGPEITLVFTPEVIGRGLLLPHLGVTILPTGGAVVAIHQDRGAVRMVRSDGQAVTLPKAQTLPQGLTQLPMLRVEPRVGPFAILNAAPEVALAFAEFVPADGSELRDAMHRLANGLGLLERVWPEAFEALSRHLSAVLLLRNRGYERSHSPTSLTGAVLMTAGAPMTIGDLLCHEASHVRMHWFKAVDPLCIAREPAAEARGFESPWRPDLRPLDGLLLGVHAFLNVCGWYRRVAFAEPSMAAGARVIHDRQADNVRRGFALLAAESQPTSVGRNLMAEFSAAVGALPHLVPQPLAQEEATHAG